MSAPHLPVLIDEVIAALAPVPGSVIVDATFGAGGYTRRLLDAGATVHAFDRDPDAIAAGSVWPETGSQPPRLVLHPRRFSELVAGLAEAGVAAVDGVVFDIGVSSMQLDQPARGFAFSSDGPLDMRMSQEGESAADFLNEADEAAIADVLYNYGEERQSRRVARAIVAARPLTTTGELARVVRKALGYRPGAPKDPATRSFQAIRIHVNGELDELRAALAAAEQVLAPGGRLAVVSFHSLEDRIVKQFLRDAGGAKAGGSRHLPHLAAVDAPSFKRPSAAIRPSEAELARNPRARSATLRWAERTAAPARERRVAA
ncbi:16S rRNA (cytosine(1402)-N(4))-methyltransferase RsmH [Novosphingobium tardum]|uniref:Ribosomal RNA small subunit methyltransferase H n=1 Tax=Novosphingobium tardum TaxID=1538021 RepID=A0ABV8RMJ9_9SPHN